MAKWATRALLANGHTHVAVFDDEGNGSTSKNLGHSHNVRRHLVLPAGAGPHVHELDEDVVKMEN